MRLGLTSGILALAMMAALATGAARAQECGPLQKIASIQMLQLSDGVRDMVPVSINGHPRLFLLDTGGFMTQISREATSELGLPTQHTSLHLYDASGNTTNSFATAESFDIANLHLGNERLLISPAGSDIVDGILASDMFLHYDLDIDFGAGTLNYVLPEHCPGKVVYWQAADAPVAVIPVTIKSSSHITLPVKLDGHDFTALLDTGASRTSISQGVARQIFGLEPGGPGNDKAGIVNADPRLSSYTHVFKLLDLEGIAVGTPRVLVFPDRVGSQTEVTGSRLKGANGLALPDLVLGMDILRHLHIYFSSKEKLLYVTPGAPLPKSEAREAILDKALALSPDNAGLLNERCFRSGLGNVHLAQALADCDRALQVHPRDAAILDSKGLVLYRLGRYPEALAIYDQVLVLAPRQAPSLFMRGQTKRKLGDKGGDADIDAAKAMDADAATPYRNTDLAKD